MKNWARKIIIGSGTLLVIVAAWFAVQAIAPFNVPSAHAQNSSNKPIDGWIVCQDLGVGTVPGLDEVRQRFKLCHPSGWEILTYCLRPGLPQPSVGASCTRTGEDTYWCGRGIQPVKEYTIVQIPTDTPPPSTATFTPATPPPPNQPTHTPEEKPTQTIPTRRPPPGGPDLEEWLGSIFESINTDINPSSDDLGNPSPTPFQPVLNPEIPSFLLRSTPSPSSTIGSVVDAMSARIPGKISSEINFNQGSQQIVVKVFPNSKRINNGNPVVIKFFPSDSCEFGDKRACVYELQFDNNLSVKWISIHSGIGGEAQAFRNAVEGTSIDQAGYSLNQINQNIATISGAPVEIHQGEAIVGNLELMALVRIPSNQVSNYLALPIEQAFNFAAQLDPTLLTALESDTELLVIETCGWKIPGEQTKRGLPNTSSSIYIGIIRQTTPVPNH